MVSFPFESYNILICKLHHGKEKGFIPKVSGDANYPIKYSKGMSNEGSSMLLPHVSMNLKSK
jgi:hypothetical protein